MHRVASALLQRPSRLIGLALLALVLALQVGFGRDDDLTFRRAWWDVLHTLMPRERVPPAEAPAVVVAIDEQSMQTLHPWPWPRSLVARLIEAAADHGARAIAFDLIFDTPDALSPPALAARLRETGRSAAAEALEALPDTDATLARAIASHDRTPTVLPVTGVVAGEGVVPEDECAFEKPIVLLDPPELTLPVGFPSADAPLLLFHEAGAALAAIDFAAADDFVIRSVQAVQNLCGAPFLLLGPEALRAASGGFFTTVMQTPTGLEIILGDPADPGTLRFPAEREGTFWLHFGHIAEGDGSLERYVRADELLDGSIERERIAGKIVLVAVIDLGRVDKRRSPLGEIIPGIEVHLQMIEQIVAGDFLRRPWFLFALETAVLALVALMVIVFVPRLPPILSIAAIVAVMTAILGGSILAFAAGVLIDAASPAIGITAVALGVIAVTLVERDRMRLGTQIALVSERADRALLQGELDAAARIQRTLLPPPRLHRTGQIDLACHIAPARTVGGDFYDHVMLDDRHLFFLVADVSGKGADASQFMVLSKTLWKSVALRTGTPLSAIQHDANAEITRENAETMFVTGLCGLLDLETGRLSYSSAGHDMPFLFGAGRDPVQLETHSGPPLGLLDGIDYPVGQCDLAAGDRLCVFTDGVTEAMNGGNELFGIERLSEALAAAPADADAEALVSYLVGRVSIFIGDAEKSDDLTLMVISIPDH